MRAGWIATAVVLAVFAPSAARANTTTSPCPSDNPFTAEFAAQLAAVHPDQTISAAVHDTRTGCDFDLNPERRITTASVAKVEIMAGVLLRAQTEERPLTTDERNLIDPMITQSANEPASTLFSSLGGVQGMRDVGTEFGLTDTEPVGAWGLTSTSARDQVNLLRQVLLGEFGPLTAPYRADARDYMSRVVHEQQWGISAGLPPDWTFALKNGFAPSECCGWRINSTGVVDDPAGGGYVIAILSDGWRTDLAGVEAVEDVSRAVASRVTRGFTAPHHFVRNSNTSGLADADAFVGDRLDVLVVGDWDGDGTDTAGIVRRGLFAVDGMFFTYGDAFEEVIVGDWDGDGVDTIAIHRGNTFYLRNSNTTGVADTVFDYGDPGDPALAGDWDGDGIDTIAIVRGSEWFIRNANTSGLADTSITFGDAGDQPIAGDWDGDGTDSVGVHRGNVFHLANTNTSGVADITLAFGDAGDEPTAGDWDGDGIDTLGIVRTRG